MAAPETDTAPLETSREYTSWLLLSRMRMHPDAFSTDVFQVIVSWASEGTHALFCEKAVM